MDKFKPGCHWCKNTGWVVALHKTKIGLFGFRCSCSNGARYSTKIPTWSSEYSRDFTPDAEGLAPVFIRPKQEEPKKEMAKPKVDFKARAAQANDWDEEEVPF